MSLRGITRSAGAVGAAAVLLAACAPGTSGAGDGSGGGSDTTLTLWSWRVEDKKAYETIFDAYEKQNPGVTVQVKTFKNDEYDTILATGLKEGGGPDVAQLRAYGGLQDLVEADRLVALDDEVDGLGDFPDRVLDGARGREDGKVYGVPFALQAMVVYYNKALFDEHGLSEPKTWDEFMSAAETLEGAGVTPFSTTGKDPWMLPIVHDVLTAPRYGGGEFEEQVLSGESDFTDSDYVASLELLNGMREYFPDDVTGVGYETSRTLFVNGQAAMFPGGSFELGFFQDSNPDFEMGVFAAPPPPDSVVDQSLTPGWVDASFGVNANSDNKQAALDLVNWMATEDFQQRFTNEVKQISPMPGVQPQDPLLAEMVQLYEKQPAPYLHLVNFRYGEPNGDVLLGEGIQSMWLGDQSPEEVAQNVQKGISEWFEPQG